MTTVAPASHTKARTVSLARVARAAGIEVRVCAPGLIPRKPTDRIKTDARDAERLARLGAITKAGSSHARRLLVEAAWHYRREPHHGAPLRRRQAGQPAHIVALA